MEPSGIDVRDALARVIASEGFAASARLQQFLSYIVDETLAGRSQKIKGKAIAAEVYQRDLADIDAGQNLVRVEAGRLRRHLAEYYQGPGSADPIRIHVDLGGYTPRFERVEITTSNPSGSQSRKPGNWRILVAAAVVVVVLSGVAVSIDLNPEPSVPGVSQEEASRTALRMRSAQALQAVNIAEQARGMFFPVFDLRRQEIALEMFRHSISLDPKLHHGYAGAAQVLATLALLSTDTASTPVTLSEAGRMADTALDLAPENGWAHGAKAWVLAVAGELDEAVSQAHLAIALSPEDGHVLDLVGITAIMANRPQIAAEMSEPGRPRSGVGRFGAQNVWGVSQFMLGDYQAVIEAFSMAPSSGAPVSAPSLVFLAVAYDRLEESAMADEYVRELEATWPDFPTGFIVRRIFRNAPTHGDDILERLANHGYEGL